MRLMQIQNKDCIHDSCRICDKKYNILLHVESKNRVRTTNILIVMDKEIITRRNTQNLLFSFISSEIIILFTAIIIVKNQYGNAKYCCQHLNLNHILQIEQCLKDLVLFEFGHIL